MNTSYQNPQLAVAIYEGKIVGEFDPASTTVEEIGLYMAGAGDKAKNMQKGGEAK